MVGFCGQNYFRLKDLYVVSHLKLITLYEVSMTFYPHFIAEKMDMGGLEAISSTHGFRGVGEGQGQVQARPV